MARRVASDPECGRELALVRCLWEAGAERREFDTNAAWRRVQARVARPALMRVGPRFAPLFTKTVVRKTVVRPPYARYALVVSVLIAFASIAIVREYELPRRPDESANASLARDYATAHGQRAVVLLADGTRIELNVASRLRVPDGYGVTAREVNLEGEAFFDVHHDAAHPFRVHAGNAVAEDMGTTFVLRAYPGDSAATVAVAAGEIALLTARPDAASVSIREGQVGEFDAAGDITVLQHADMRRYLGWTEGRFEFRDTPFLAVARDLERWYDVHISIADSTLSQAKITASFANHQSLDDALRIVARSLGARYSHRGMQVRFYNSNSRP